MASDEVNVIALVENLELPVPRRLPARLLQQLPTTSQGQQNRFRYEKTSRVLEIKEQRTVQLRNIGESTRIDNSNKAATSKSLESLEILRRLPPGTVLIKQVEEKNPQRHVEERMAIRTSTKTSDETETERPRKISQRIRNKKTLEVRRNPLRTASRKDHPMKSRTSSRQRLLAANKRRGNGIVASTTEPKRTRSASSYITTRSVAKKLGNVGATYEAPTRSDELEWKEWPVHGMHERPFYHPQFGLVSEYNGKLFASLNGEAYQEIAIESPIEIVRVDPRVDRLDLHYQVRNLSGNVARQQQQQTSNASSVTRQMMNPNVSTYGRPRLPTVGYVSQTGHTVSLEQAPALRLNDPKDTPPNRPLTSFRSNLSQTYNPTYRQQQAQPSSHLEQLRNQLENLQRIQQNTLLMRMQQNTKSYSQVNVSGNGILQQEIYRHIHQQQQQPQPQSSASKCLIMTPRTNVTAPVAMPFCSVPASYKGNNIGQVFFVRASDVPANKSIPERTSTITSSTQIFSNVTSNGSSWNESNLRKILEGMSSTTSGGRTYSGIPSMSQAQQRHAQTSRGFPVVAPLTTEHSKPGIYRATQQKPIALRDHLKLAANATDDHMAVVLDLSKKVQRDVGEKEERKTDPQSYATDLVHYFQNFNADENLDASEEPKNLS